MKKSAEKFDFNDNYNKHDQSHDLDDGIKNLRDFFSENSIDDVHREDLAADYASLFLGVGKHLASWVPNFCNDIMISSKVQRNLIFTWLLPKL